MRALSLYAGMLLITGAMYVHPPAANADAQPPGQDVPAVDYTVHTAAEPTSLSFGAVLAAGMLVAWKIRNRRAG
jgi:hypothetical protein